MVFIFIFLFLNLFIGVSYYYYYLRKSEAAMMLDLNSIFDPKTPHVEPQKSHKFSEFNFFIS